jgi:Carboxypeptidase regulatory-like domain
MTSRCSLKLASLVLAIVLGSQAALAQGIQGTINGEVKDQTGAVIPGATVMVINVDTRESRVQQSSSVGTFSFPKLAIGTYAVTAELSGFKRVIRENVRVQANQVVDVKMTPLHLAVSVHRMRPSASPYSVGVPEKCTFAAEYPARTYPCQRFGVALASGSA